MSLSFPVWDLPAVSVSCLPFLPGHKLIIMGLGLGVKAVESRDMENSRCIHVPGSRIRCPSLFKDSYL